MTCAPTFSFRPRGRTPGRDGSPHDLQASLPATTAVAPLGMRLPPQEGFQNAPLKTPLCIPRSVHPHCLLVYSATTQQRANASRWPGRHRCGRRLFRPGAKPLRKSDGPPLPGSLLPGVSRPKCLLVYCATIRQRANARLRKTPQRRAPSLLTARPFGAKVLLVDNERISLPANSETLAVAQSRSPKPSNTRSC
jgi:hypothetical protein